MIGAISYGLLSTLIKWANQDGLYIYQVTTGQVLLGTIVLWLIVIMRPKLWSNPFKGPWIQLALIGIFGLFGTTYLFNYALGMLDASLAIVLLFQFTWITMLMDCISRKAMPTFYQVVAIIFIMCGTFFAVNIFAIEMMDISIVGLIFGLLSAVTYASFIFFTGQMKTTMEPVMRSAVMWTAAVPILFFIWPPNYFSNLDIGQFVFWGVILGVLGQVIPTITFTIGIPKIGSSLAALIGSMELPSAILFAFLILKEDVNLYQWLGILLILFGIFISDKKIKS